MADAVNGQINIIDLFKQLSTLQMQVKDQIAHRWTFKKEVVFLVYKASCWNAMESVWRAAMADPDYDVYVIAIPWYYRNYEGGIRSESHCEADLLPDYVPVTPYTEYDFQARHPYMTVIQNPYDYYNFSTSTDPRYYSHILKSQTENLVYIPWFLTDEFDINDPEDGKAAFNMRYYAATPGVVHSDLVIVQSELMRKNYIEHLTEFAGEQSRSQWENKILGLGSPILEQKDDPAATSRIWCGIKHALEAKSQRGE